MPPPVFSARCNIYNSCLYYDVSVRLSVTEVHWHIIANLGFKFQVRVNIRGRYWNALRGIQRHHSSC